MSNNKCSVCGEEFTVTDRTMGFTCDECGSPICERCYGTLVATHVRKPTKRGIVGFVKFCPSCQKRHNNSTTETYID
jgi:predicted RNA-binding Zn-ribbon protein involved in translation (DUF1610 family)